MLHALCVYCGSNAGASPIYMDAAVTLGGELARRKIRLIYGGSDRGTMGALANAVLANGGEVTGIIPSGYLENEAAHRGLPDLRIAGSMHERKALMTELCDAFLTMPGGYGTFDELCEALSWAQLQIHSKPVGIWNINGFFDPFLGQLDRAVNEGFLKPQHRALLHDSADLDTLLSRLTPVAATPATPKWL
ncbi:MAG: TIGR00730 family Rossman fold protein [Acidobacteriota bacterium]